jgi:hypothetical protein
MKFGLESFLRNNRGRMWLKIMDSDSGGYLSAKSMGEFYSYIEGREK